MRFRKLLAALTALCLLTGCGAQSSAPAQSTPPAQSSAPQSEEASTSPEAEQSASAEERTVPAGGSSAGLSWEFERKHFSTTESSGREVHYSEYTYPVFSGEGSKALNESVYNWVMVLDNMDEAGQKSGVDDTYLDGYKDYMDEESLEGMLPFYDALNLDTVWADEDYVSISGDTGFWSGGAHPYFYQTSVVLRREDGAELYLANFVDPDKLPQMVKDRFPEDAYTDDEDFRADMIERVAGMAAEPEAFRLEEGGLRLYYNVGDAVPRLEIFLPHEVLEW